MDIAAVSFGAGMVEKTISENRFFKSCEHSFSLERKDALKFVESIRDLEKAIGKNRRIIPSEIRSKRLITRRSPYFIKPIDSGDRLTIKHFEFKRPGFGISENQVNDLLGKK